MHQATLVLRFAQFCSRVEPCDSRVQKADWMQYYDRGPQFFLNYGCFGDDIQDFIQGSLYDVLQLRADGPFRTSVPRAQSVNFLIT